MEGRNPQTQSSWTRFLQASSRSFAKLVQWPRPGYNLTLCGTRCAGCIVSRPTEAGGEEDESKESTKITFWSNGFQVDDGPFRDSEAPENKAFLANIEKGYACHSPPTCYSRLLCLRLRRPCCHVQVHPTRAA